MNIENWNMELWDASGSGDIARMKTALSHGASASGSNDPKYSALRPLANACDGSHLEAAKLLIAHGADINFQVTFPFKTPISFAFEKNNMEISRLLLDNGAKPSETDFLRACENGWFGIVRDLVEGGEALFSQVSEELKRDVTLLRWLRSVGRVRHFLDNRPDCPPKAEARGIDIAKYLLGRGSSFVSKAHLDSGLMMACNFGEPDLIKILLDRGANVAAVEKPNVGSKISTATPLMLAALSGNPDAVRCLLRSGADPQKSGNPNFSVLTRLINFAERSTALSFALTVIQEKEIPYGRTIGDMSVEDYFPGGGAAKSLELAREVLRSHRSDLMAEAIGSAMGGGAELPVVKQSSLGPSL